MNKPKDKNIERLNAYLNKKHKKAVLMQKLQAVSDKLGEMSDPKYFTRKQAERDFDIRAYVSRMTKNH